MDMHTYLDTYTLIYVFISNGGIKKDGNTKVAFLMAESDVSAEKHFPHVPFLTFPDYRNVTADARCSKLENFFLSSYRPAPLQPPPPSSPSNPLSHGISLPRCENTTRPRQRFSQTSLCRARSNLVSKAELYGGSSSLLTLRSMQVTKKLFLSVLSGPLINSTSLFIGLPYTPTLHLLLASFVHARRAVFHLSTNSLEVV